MTQLRVDIAPLAEKLEAGDIRTCATLISRIEDRDPSIRPLLADLYRRTVPPRVIGLTGPPGVGKSTTINAMIRAFRKRGESVAVLAVDPSSPKSGGAVLGDRVRLSCHSDDPGVYIRSMATRGSVGGLALAVADALVVLGSMPWNAILLESVGVGQNEVDIALFADPVIVLQTAHGGDAIQTSKAGLLEVGDIFAVNKADDPGTGKMTYALSEMIERVYRSDLSHAWRPPVIETQAISGNGIPALIDAIDARARFIAEHPEESRRRVRARIDARIRATLTEHVATLYSEIAGSFEPLIHDVIARRADPYQLCDAVMARITTK